MAQQLSREIIAMDRDKDGSLEWNEIWPAFDNYYKINIKYFRYKVKKEKKVKSKKSSSSSSKSSSSSSKEKTYKKPVIISTV